MFPCFSFCHLIICQEKLTQFCTICLPKVDNTIIGHISLKHRFWLFSWCLVPFVFLFQVQCFFLLSQFLGKFRSFAFCHSGANLRAGWRGGCLGRFAYIYMFSLEWIGFPIFIEYLLKPHAANFVFQLLALHKFPVASPAISSLPKDNATRKERSLKKRLLLSILKKIKCLSWLISNFYCKVGKNKSVSAANVCKHLLFAQLSNSDCGTLICSCLTYQRHIWQLSL